MVRTQADRQVPVVEWWDAFYLTQDAYPPADGGAMAVDGGAPTDLLRRELITHLVQHPVLAKPPREEAEPKPKEMFLTKEVRDPPADGDGLDRARAKASSLTGRVGVRGKI